MTSGLLHLLLLLSFPLLAGLGGVGWLIADADRRQQAVALRIAHVLPHSRRLPVSASIARTGTARAAPTIRLASLFGCDLLRDRIYPSVGGSY